jgi:glyoxylase I family protein
MIHLRNHGEFTMSETRTFKGFRCFTPYTIVVGAGHTLNQRAWALCFAALATAGWMGLLMGAARTNDVEVRGNTAVGPQDEPGALAKSDRLSRGKMGAFRAAGIRYLVKDVDRSIVFYTQHLGFKLEQQSGAAFASVSNGGLTVKLSGPKSSGARPLPDGRRQEPGGWNRIILEVDDLPSRVAAMKQEGLRFRNKIETGPGGKQIQLEDPDGNPIELFEPAL